MTNSNNTPTLSRAECAAMRGVAILGIVLHNYCHWLRMAVKENEYTFTQGNADGIWHAMMNPSWNLPVHLVSFFGHYGVPVFLFLSAYGLTMKYEKGGAEDRVWPFIKKHFVKLFTMMIFGYAAFLMVDRMVDGPHHYHLMDIVSQLGMFNNLMPDPDHIIWPGPYWFFGLMMQLYVVYRLVLYKRHWGFTVALMAVCFLMQCFCDPMGDTLNRVRYNFIGGMLPFGLGLLYARFEDRLSFSKSWGYWVALFGSLLLIVGWSMEYQAWFWVPAMVCVFAVSLVKVTPKSINGVLSWVGVISSAMFVCHPITRKIFIPISRHGDIYTGLLMYIVATIVLAILFKAPRPPKGE